MTFRTQAVQVCAAPALHHASTAVSAGKNREPPITAERRSGLGVRTMRIKQIPSVPNLQRTGESAHPGDRVWLSGLLRRTTAPTSIAHWTMSGFLPIRSLELADTDLTVGEHGADFEMATKSLDILDQSANTNVGAILYLGNLALVYAEDFAELELRHFASFAERIEGHRRNALLKALLEFLTPRRRHRFDQLSEIAS
ncbi:MAG: hypothetical protein U0Q16_02590 [Bryobacteraceae bacterium]